MSQSSDDERQLPPSVEAASQMVYRSSGLGVWGAVLRFGGMPLEKIALFSNSSQVSGKGQLGQAVKLTFAEGMLAPFRVVGPASFVAWFLQYSVMGFVFQSCDRTLSKVMGVPNVYYGDELFEPGNRTPAANVRPAPARPLLTRAALPAAKKSETAVPVGDQAKSIAKAVAAPLLAGVVESAVSNRAEVQRYYGIEQFAKIESKLGWCVSPSAALCATGTPVQTPAARATQERHLAQHGPRFRRELVAQLCHVDHLVRAHADPVQAVLPAGAEVAGTRRRPVASLSLSLFVLLTAACAQSTLFWFGLGFNIFGGNVVAITQQALWGRALDYGGLNGGQKINYRAVVKEGLEKEGWAAFFTPAKWFARVLMNAPAQGPPANTP